MAKFVFFVHLLALFLAVGIVTKNTTVAVISYFCLMSYLYIDAQKRFKFY